MDRSQKINFSTGTEKKCAHFTGQDVKKLICITFLLSDFNKIFRYYIERTKEDSGEI